MLGTTGLEVSRMLPSRANKLSLQPSPMHAFSQGLLGAVAFLEMPAVSKSEVHSWVELGEIVSFDRMLKSLVKRIITALSPTDTQTHVHTHFAGFPGQPVLPM